MSEDELIQVDLADDEWNLLYQGVLQLGGPSALDAQSHERSAIAMRLSCEITGLNYSPISKRAGRFHAGTGGARR